MRTLRACALGRGLLKAVVVMKGSGMFAGLYLSVYKDKGQGRLAPRRVCMCGGSWGRAAARTPCALHLYAEAAAALGRRLLRLGDGVGHVVDAAHLPEGITRPWW